MNDNKMERSEIMEKESPKTETGEMTSETNIEAAEDVIVEAGAVCDGADEIIVDEQAEGGEDTLVEEAAAPAKKGLRKRSIALIAAIVCLLAVAVGGTYAYYTASEQTINVISMRGLDLVLHEEDENKQPWGEEKSDEDGNKWREVTGVMPSNSIWKKVYVENYLKPEEKDTPEVKADFYTRIQVTMRVENAEGKEIDAADYAQYITVNYNTEDWTYAPDPKIAKEKAEKGEDLVPGDYWYFYMKDGGVVKPGEVTDELFSYVTFDKTMPNAYQNAKVYMDIEAQATQVKHNDENGPLGAAW